MGFGFRKTFSSGPFRFTISRGSVSSSFGVRGARITAGPSGTFITVSSHGAFYRHRIAPRNDLGSKSNLAQGSDQPDLDSVFQVPSHELTASNQGELITKLNESASATNPGTFILALSLLAILLLPSYPILGAICIFSGLLLGLMLFQHFESIHTHEVHYSLEPQVAKRFAATQIALSALSSCSGLWVLNTQLATADFKRNAGATTLITRKPVSVGRIRTKGFKPSLPVSSISANGTIFHFLPDQVLLFTANRYSAVQYEELTIEFASKRFIEEGLVPRDSTQVDTTWRFVNKNGGPDKRFKNNRQIPVLQYGEATLSTKSGLNVLLQTSNLEKARAFTSQFNILLKGATSEHWSQGEQGKTSSSLNDLLECYILLGLKRPVTLEQASAAHHHQASLYHPDKYEHLAPEMKELALVKMKLINVAYARIKLDASM